MADDDNRSLAIAPRNYSDIVRLQEPNVLDEFLEHPLTASLEAITGAFAGGGKGLLVSAGRIAQGLVKGRIYAQLAEELLLLRKVGRIPENLGETKYGLPTWAELMAIIDDDCPDPERLEALKAMFYAVNRIKSEDTEGIQAYQLWQIAKHLDSGDLLLLKTLSEKEHMIGSEATQTRWVEQIAIDSGFGLGELVLLHVSNLAKWNLASEGSNISNPKIKALGRKLCLNIQTYRLDLESVKGQK